MKAVKISMKENPSSITLYNLQSRPGVLRMPAIGDGESSSVPSAFLDITTVLAIFSE